MIEHMKLNELPKEFRAAIKEWLTARYGEEESVKIWEAISDQYYKYLDELPDYGGKI